MIDLAAVDDRELLDLLRPDVGAAAARAGAAAAGAGGDDFRFVHGERREGLAILVATAAGGEVLARLVVALGGGTLATLFIDAGGTPDPGFALEASWHPPACPRTGARAPVNVWAAEAESGATALRIRRRGVAASGDVALVRAGALAVVVEPAERAPPAAFLAVARGDTWEPALAPEIAASLCLAADCWNAARGGDPAPDGVPLTSGWMEDMDVRLPWPAFEAMVLRLLPVFRLPRHAAGVAALSAILDEPDEALLDGLLAAGAAPAVLHRLLATQRSERLPKRLAARHRRLVERLARRAEGEGM